MTFLLNLSKSETLTFFFVSNIDIRFVGRAKRTGLQLEVGFLPDRDDEIGHLDGDHATFFSDQDSWAVS